MAALSPGTRLGIYEVIEPIGAGGMGEVYRARDTELGREVAIKVLPDDFAEDEERVARFRREAQVLASLNHPNIAAIYGVESNALVLELVEGPTLAELIDRGPIPLDDAIAIARQITLALEAAHEAGVIHRDLKPANIKVQDDGTVKVLDFGLAKAIEGEADGSASESPTMTAAATRAGMIMGTAAYMSPEQARGKRVDRRADIWSFGVVVYEMLTGRRAFEAEDISLTLAEVMKSEPDWEALPSDLSPTLRIYLTQCLEKDPKLRVRDIGDVRLAMDGVFETSAPPPRLVTQPRIGWPAIAAALALALSGITGIVVWSSRPESSKPVARFVVNAPSEAPGSGRPDVDVAITPDGTRVVYAARFTGERELVVRDVNDLETIRLGGPGDEKRGVFVSPDGNWVGYVDKGVLWRASILGGPPVAVCDISGARGASWGPDDTIIFATNDPTSGLWRVPAGGGEPEELTTPNFSDLAEGDHLWPEILPGGEAVLFTLAEERRAESAQIAVLSLDSGEVKVLLSGGSNPRYVSSGHIVYGIGGTLRVVGFDLDRLEVTSAPIPVLDGVVTKASGAADFAISQSGSLVYVAGESDAEFKRTLLWVDRDGREEPLAAEPRPYYYPRISPDGTRLALDARDQDSDIWIWDFSRETLTRLTFDLGRDMGPTWSPDGRRVAFGSERNGAADLFWKEADGAGTADRLSESGNIQVPQSFSPDGTLLVFWELGGPTGWDLHVRRMDGDGGSEPLLVTEFNEYSAVISPDGRWLAYESDESGEREVYVRPFPAVDEGRWQISRNGGTQPVWARDGRELFYLTLDGELNAVPIRADSTFDMGNPTALFAQKFYVMRADSRRRTYDVSPDGKRFLMMKEGDPAGEVVPRRVILVQNWTEELKRLVPTDN